MTQIDTQFDKERPAYGSLLTILRFEVRVSGGRHHTIANECQLIANGLSANQTILELVGKLLDLPHYDTIVSEAKDPSDVELLLDFILYVRGRSVRLFDLCHTPCSYSAIIACQTLAFKMPTEKPEDSCPS